VERRWGKWLQCYPTLHGAGRDCEWKAPTRAWHSRSRKRSSRADSLTCRAAGASDLRVRYSAGGDVKNILVKEAITLEANILA